MFANGYKYLARILDRAKPSLFMLEYFESVAKFDLIAAAQDTTELLLDHYGVSMDHWNAVHAGWLNALLPLKASLAFGIDLRNHDPHLE